MYKNDQVDHLLVNHEKWKLQVDWGLQYCNWLDHPKLVCETSCNYFVGDSCSILAGFTIRGVVDDMCQSIFCEAPPCPDLDHKSPGSHHKPGCFRVSYILSSVNMPFGVGYIAFHYQKEMLHLPKNGQMGGLLLTRLYIETQKTIELYINLYYMIHPKCQFCTNYPQSWGWFQLKYEVSPAHHVAHLFQVSSGEVLFPQGSKVGTTEGGFQGVGVDYSQLTWETTVRAQYMLPQNMGPSIR